ncbi:MAG TPA: M48 family metallopeptidase [Candidatus Cybelea sp.]|nr:M48 family metallopeptidase [Candidatus Cybelea sp.]
MSEAAARYSDGRTAKSRDVRIALNDASLLVHDGNETIAMWPLAEIRLVERPLKDGIVRICRREGEERLTFHDAAFYASLRLAAPNLAATPYEPTPWRTLGIWLGTAVAALAILFAFVLPHFAEVASAMLPPKLEQRMGNWISEGVIRQLRVIAPGKRPKAICDAAAGSRSLQSLVGRLARHASLRFPLHVRVVDSSMVNAFALPGGQIVVLRGLVDFAQTPNELAGVLAHEIAHVKFRHPTELVIKQSTTGFVIGLIFGDVIGATTFAGMGAAVIGATYTRAAEADADRRGLELLQQAGIDGTAWADLFDRLAKKEEAMPSALSLLANHPPTPLRAELIRKASHGGEEALSLADWRALKEICD